MGHRKTMAMLVITRLYQILIISRSLEPWFYTVIPGLVNVYITNWKDPPFLMGNNSGQFTISMTIFNSYVTNYQRVCSFATSSCESNRTYREAYSSKIQWMIYRSKGDVTWLIDSDNIQKDPIISNHNIQKYRPKYTISPTISNSQQYSTRSEYAPKTTWLSTSKSPKPSEAWTPAHNRP